MNNRHAHRVDQGGAGGTYHTRVTGRAARVLPLLLVVIASGVAISGVGGTTAAVVVAVISLVVWALLDVRLSAGPEGVGLSFGPWAWPRIRVAAAEIEGTSVEQVNPLAYGGWGYRVRPGVRAVLIRRGPAIRIVRQDGPDLLVSTPDAQRLADALAAPART